MSACLPLRRYYIMPTHHVNLFVLLSLFLYTKDDLFGHVAVTSIVNLLKLHKKLLKKKKKKKS